MNNFIKGLYDASAGIPDENGIPKMDEQKLKRTMDKSNIGRRNEDIFAEEPKSKSCPRYEPCPLCRKCMNKSSALYVACQYCKIPTCSHTYEQKEKMIRQSNFRHIVSKDVMQAIIDMDKKNITGKYALKED